MNPANFDELPEELRKISRKVQFDEDGRIGTTFEELPPELQQVARQVDFEDETFLGSLGKSATEVPGFGARGLAKGAALPGGILDLLGLQAPGLLPGEEQRIQAEAQEPVESPSFASMLGEDELLPPTSRIASPGDVQDFSRLLGAPKRAETPIGRGAERLGRAIPPALLTGGLGKLALAAVGGQAFEELSRLFFDEETSERIGDAGEIISGIGLPAFGKGVPAIGKTKKFIENAKKLNLNDQEIAILTRKPGKTKALLKFGKKTEKTQNLIESINKNLGGSYEQIKTAAEKLPKTGFVGRARLVSRFEKVLKDLQRGGEAFGDKKNAIEFISSKLEEIRKGTVRIDPRYMIDVFQDANASINWRSIKGGSKKLAAIKDPILLELRHASPELATDFETTNKLYSNFSNISKSFKPGVTDNLIDAGKVLGGAGTVLTGIITLNPGLIGKAAGTLVAGEAARRFLTKLATDPKFMNMGKKAAVALNENKPQVALNIARKIVNQMSKELDVDEDELMKAFIANEPQPSPNK